MKRKKLYNIKYEAVIFFFACSLLFRGEKQALWKVNPIIGKLQQKAFFYIHTSSILVESSFSFFSFKINRFP